MATNCEDVSARMVELLYGELPADARSGVDAHVAGCARCRSELQGLEKTRAVTRQALDESPPPRARAEILRRAAEHLAAQQPAAAAAAAAPIAPAGKPRKTKAAAPEQTGLWDWLRSRWTVPSLATVGAVALLVIGSRVLLEPANVDYKGSPGFQREAQQAARPAASPPPAELAPLPTPAAEKSFAADKDTAAQPPEAVAVADSKSEEEIAGNGRGGKLASASRRSRAKAEANVVTAAPPATASTSTSGPPVKKKQAERDRGDEGRFAPPPPPKPVTGFKMDSDDAPVAATKPAARHRSASAPSGPADLDQLLEGGKSPAPAKGGGLGASSSAGGYGAGVGGAGKPVERSLTKERAASEAPAPRVAVPAAEPAAPPPAAAMPPPAAPAPPVRRESEKKDKRAPAAAADEESAAAPAEAKPSSKSKASAETAADRANRLFTEGRWAEAAAAYRELLRRDPNNAEAPRWRQRMAVAEAALESRRPTEPARAAPTQ